MFQQSFRYLIGLFLAVLACVFSGTIWFWYRDFSDTKVMFLDVGQGDAILISQGSNQVLIDGGRSGKVLLERLSEYLPFWDRSLEAVVATHPDEDHIGGLVELVDTYHIGMFLDTRMKSDTETYRALQEAKQRNHLENREVFAGLSIRFPLGGTIETVFPHRSFADSGSKDTNATSIVMKLTTVSGKTFLFTGDLPSEEEPSVDAGHIDVLKAGHHGSKYSSSDGFLERVSPHDAILSVGAKNRYGHPAPETLDRLGNHHVENLFRTDTQGTIVYHCPSEKDADCVVTTGKD